MFFFYLISEFLLIMMLKWSIDAYLSVETVSELL